MPETIKALIVILTLGNALLYFHNKNLPSFISLNEAKRWQFLWITVTCAAFLSHNYWLFILIALGLIKAKDSSNSATRFANYLWLLPALPLLANDIPGFGGIRFLFELNFPRLLSLLILFPIFLNQSNKSLAFMRMPGDKLFAIFLLINMIISTRNGEITNILRSNVYIFLDIFLPYYAASRSLSKFIDFQRISYVAFAFASVLAFLAIFETIRAWHLYSPLSSSLGIYQHSSAYLFRDGILRADGPFSGGIVLGYVLTFGLGLGLPIKDQYKKNKFFLFTIIISILGLLATASRGPWVGAALMYFIYILLSKNKAKHLKTISFGALAALPLLFFTSIGQKIVAMLPFIGESSTGSISYRQQLLEQSWIVIQRHPFLGSNTYMETPEMQTLIQGQGIIDIVNSYVRIALDSGLLGVTAFILIFFSLTYKLYKVRKKLINDSSELYNYANALIATMIAMLFIIATVSSIDIIEHLYWIMAGLMSSYIHFLQSLKNNKAKP